MNSPSSPAADHSADRRAQIVAAATALMAERGGQRTSIAAVAERAGLTDAGVLYHFKTKQALLLAVLQQFDAGIGQVVGRDGVPGIELLTATREWGAGMEQIPELQALLIHFSAEHLSDDGPEHAYLEQRYRTLLERYTAAFADAAAQGHLRADLDPVSEASAFLAHLDGIRFQWFILDGEISMAESVRTYVNQTLTRLARTQET